MLYFIIRVISLFQFDLSEVKRVLSYITTVFLFLLGYTNFADYLINKRRTENK